MADKLKSNQGVLAYYLGGTFDNAPSYSSAVTFTCYVKNYRRRVTVNSVDAAALCDTTERNIPLRSGGEVSFDAMVDVTNGPIFQLLAGTYLKTSFTPVSGGTAIIDEGYIESVELSAEVDQMQMEKVTMKLGVQGV